MSLLHLPLLLPSLVEEHPQRKRCLAFLVGEPHGYFASTNPDHFISLGRKHIRPWPRRGFCSTPAAHYCGCSMSRMARLLPRRSSIPDGSSLVPACSQTQLAEVVYSCEGFLQGNRHRVSDPWVRRRKSQCTGETPAYHGPGKDSCSLPKAHGGYGKHEPPEPIRALSSPLLTNIWHG